MPSQTPIQEARTTLSSTASTTPGPSIVLTSQPTSIPDISSSANLLPPAIGGIAAGAVVGILSIARLIFYLVRRSRREPDYDTLVTEDNSPFIPSMRSESVEGRVHGDSEPADRREIETITIGNS